jgi:hypothetical protein
MTANIHAHDNELLINFAANLDGQTFVARAAHAGNHKIKERIL